MRLYGHDFEAGTVERICRAIAADEELTRSELSRQVCEWLNWRSPNGSLCEMSCRKALLKLEALGKIRLPTSRGLPGERNAEPSALVTPFVAPRFAGTLAELGRIELAPIEAGTMASQQWREMFNLHHPLKSGPLCGAQQRYLIRSEQIGWLGGLSFSAAAWHLTARDQWIGWTPLARSQNLPKVVNNSRFLILPTIKVPQLASHILGMAARRIKADWIDRYGYAPVLLETFVDEMQFSGTCYRAANWQRLGETSGRGRNDASGTADIGRKSIYVYPLDQAWQAQLCMQSDRSFRLPEATHDDDKDWEVNEFGRVEFSDGRLRQRLQGLARHFYARPLAPINQACNGDQGKIKGAYRFFKNAQVNMDTLLKPHIEATARRIQNETVVLAVQDTTSLNYSTHHAMNGLGPINTRKDGAQGLKLHDTLAFTPDGTPLGVLHIECWARTSRDDERNNEHKTRSIEEKESYRWLQSYQRVREIQSLCPDTRLISVGDREADIYELFQEAAKEPNGPDLLVRANHACQRKTTEQQHLQQHLANQLLAGQLDLYIPEKGGRKARTALLEIRYAEVAIKPPKRLQGSAPIKLWSIYAHEPNPPTDTDAVEWLLLTTVETINFEQACERLSWYATRWNIEVYHRVLKSGCRIEDRRLGDAETLQACLAIDLVVAWRIFRLTMLGRKVPNVSCEIFFREEEWKALYVYHTKNPRPPEVPPTLNKAIRMMAKLGGFIGRKDDGEPGTISLWRGIQRLDDITETFIIMSTIMPAAP